MNCKRYLIWIVIVLLCSFALVAPTTTHAQDACDTTNGVMLGTLAYGFNCLDESGWHSYGITDSSLPFSSISALAVCPDNRLMVLDIFGLYTYDGSSWSEGEGDSTVIGARGMACGADGQLWVAHLNGASYFDGSTWTQYPEADFGSDPFIIGLNDAAVGSDGTAWVLSSASIARFNAGTWEVFEDGNGYSGDYTFSKMVVDANGQPWVSHSTGLLHLEDGEWKNYESDATTLQALAIDADNNLWVGTYDSGLMMFDGSEWTTYNKDNGLMSNNVHAVAVDALGRVWVGTEWGLHVYDRLAQNATWTVYSMDNSDLLDNATYLIKVFGNGPTLPEAVQEAPGSVVGSIEMGSDVVPNARVELCTEALGIFFEGDTPCEGQPAQQVTTTDESGVFSFAEVPAGRYEIVVEGPDGWVSFIGIGAEFEVLSGEETDLTDIDISQ